MSAAGASKKPAGYQRAAVLASVLGSDHRSSLFRIPAFIPDRKPST